MNNLEWHDLPREETASKRLEPKDIGDGVIRENLGLGINLYHNAIKNPQEIIDVLNQELDDSEKFYKWSYALVNEKENVSKSRLCFDFKYSDQVYDQNNPKSQKIQKEYEKVKYAVKHVMSDYNTLWNFTMTYYEAYNFVKYGAGEYFKTHVDHGPFNCYTTSLVVYLNDDYEGGEIEWNRFGIKVKPTAGSIAVFPSNFIYEHESHLITSGMKYAVVIMSDYNSLNHGAQSGQARNY